MIGKRYDLQEKDLSSLKKRTLLMILAGSLILTAICFLQSILMGDLPAWNSLYLAYGFVVLFCMLLLILKLNYKITAAIVMSITQFIFLPLLFFHEGGLVGPVPIWMVLHIIFIILVFEEKGMILFLILTLCEYSYLLSRVYHYPELVRIPESGTGFLTGTVFSFLVVSCWLLLLIFVQQSSFTKEIKRREQNEHRINHFGIMKSGFLYDMSMSLRQPMTSIMGMCELILKEEQDHLIHNEMLKVKSSCYDFLSLIDDTLNYSRLEQEKSTYQEINYRFDELITSVIDSVADEMYDKNLRFIVDVGADIPCMLYGDSRRIRQVFLQVLRASISMTFEGRIRLSIIPVREHDSGYISFLCKVSDTGRGMKEEEVCRFFGGYETYQSSEGGNHLEGVELKLSVCREYLSTMGGSIGIESLEYVGMTTTFTFRNRIVDEQLSAPAFTGAPPGVLIYEEDDIDRANWNSIMTELSLFPTFVHNRYSFECAVREKKYDFIFLSRPVFESLNTIIAYYHCEKETYVVGDYASVYGDFGKCRLIRFPIYSIKISRVLHGEWREEDYRYSQRQGSFSVKGSKILVIDDNAVDLKVATGIFAKYGVDIDIAVSAAEGLKKLAQEKYHLILTDLLMPGMNGVEVLNKVREIPGENQDTPIGAITSDIRENIREITIKQGFQYYMDKPIKIKDIEECLLQFLPEELIVRKEKKVSGEIRGDDFVREERGLNTTVGLSNIGYNEESYAAILNTYYTENMRKQENLDDVFKKEELPAFISAVHGIKSASASIGAMGLSALARELEFAGKDGDISLITEKLPLFLKEYQLILDEIRVYLERQGKFKEQEVKREQWGTEAVQLSADALTGLKTQMDKMDLKACGAILETLSSVNYGSEMNERIREIKQAFERFDFHNAKKIIMELLENNADKKTVIDKP